MTQDAATFQFNGASTASEPLPFGEVVDTASILTGGKEMDFCLDDLIIAQARRKANRSDEQFLEETLEDRAEALAQWETFKRRFTGLDLTAENQEYNIQGHRVVIRR
jgi:hypothetical protein